MFESFNQTSDVEVKILRELRVWIVALGLVCALTGMGIGAMLAGRPAVAQDVARTPEALSASFVDIQTTRPAPPRICVICSTAAGFMPPTGRLRSIPP